MRCHHNVFMVSLFRISWARNSTETVDGGRASNSTETVDGGSASNGIDIMDGGRTRKS